MRALVHPRLQRWVVLLALLLALPSLFFGFAIDDRLQRQLALGRSTLYDLGPLELFSFVPGPADRTLKLIESGFGAWWSDVNARIVLLRPISSGLMWLDHQLLGHPIAIHAHSLLWLAATVALAGALYRRLIVVPWIAGLASLMFAIDPTHGLLAGWVAQRNALIAGTFGLAALLAGPNADALHPAEHRRAHRLPCTDHRAVLAKPGRAAEAARSRDSRSGRPSARPSRRARR